MVSISLSIKEAEYLRSLVRADVATRETEGPYQNIAKDLYDLIVTGRPTIIADMSAQRRDGR